MLLQPLAIDTPIAGFNGGQWVNPDLSIIEGHTLPRDIADKTVKMLTDHGLDVWVYSGADWLIHKAGRPPCRAGGMDGEISAQSGAGLSATR